MRRASWVVVTTRRREEAAEILRRNRYRGQFISAPDGRARQDDAAVERTLKALLSEFPDSSPWPASTRRWLADQGRVPEAFAVVDAFQRRRPGDPVALYQVGRSSPPSPASSSTVASRRSRYLTLAPSPATGIPTLSNAHFRLGTIQEKRGDAVAARASYELAVRLDGRNELARRALAALK